MDMSTLTPGADSACSGRSLRNRAEAEYFVNRSVRGGYRDPAKGEKNWGVVEQLRDVRLASGETFGTRLESFHGGRVLVPCCGVGGLEFTVRDRLGAAVDAFDLDDRLLAEAREGRSVEGVRQFVADANDVVLEPDRYDLILVINAAHHVEDLEHFFGTLNRSLKADGILVGHEYVGENRIGYFEENLAWIRRVWALIPEEYKHGECRPEFRRPDTARLSPNEGIRCREIPRIARETFRVVHEKGIHAIDWPIFQRLVLPVDGPGADPVKVREGRMIREWVGLLEAVIMESGLLPGHGMTFVAEKRS